MNYNGSLIFGGGPVAPTAPPNVATQPNPLVKPNGTLTGKVDPQLAQSNIQSLYPTALPQDIAGMAKAQMAKRDSAIGQPTNSPFGRP